MKIDTMSHWFQIFASIGVLAGLVLVYIEVRQTNSLQYIDRVADEYHDIHEDWRTGMGEESYKVVAKACYEPESLTKDEAVVFGLMTEMKLSRAQSYKRIAELRDISYGMSWRQLATPGLYSILATAPGRRWFAARRSSIDPDIADLLDEILEAEKSDCRKYYDAIMGRKQQTEG